MPYDLDQFNTDLLAIIRKRGVEGLPEIAGNLRTLLSNPAFAAATFNENIPPGKRELFHDFETDAYVLAHVQVPGKGVPHSHGASWAVYGNVRGATQMTEWCRLNPEAEEGAVLKPTEHYTLCPGEARAYGPGMIHSTEQLERCWVIRITGTNLDALPRFRFSPKRDRIVEAAQPSPVTSPLGKEAPSKIRAEGRTVAGGLV